MSDHFELERWKAINADSGEWYQAVRLLAPGRNAATFLAVCTSGPNHGIPFAIKVFRRISTPEAKKRFLDEARFLRGVSHPAIMRIYDEGTYYGENPFVVAEYLPLTLRKIIDNNRALVTERLTYSIQLLSAVRFLQSQNPKVVHRDIKAENVFIKGLSCVLGDFGLIKRSPITDDDNDREMIKISHGPGMPLRCRTPELRKYLRKEPVVIAKSDIYQLGLLLAELFTGKNPQRQADDYTDPIVLDRVERISGEIGAGIASLLNRMLQEDPSERPDIDYLMDNWLKVFRGAVDQHLYLNDEIW